jgi:rhodanese-related sulfurtransferase
MAEIPSVQPLELHKRSRDGDSLTLLDVREPDERAYCAIPASPEILDIHIPMREIPARLDEIRAASQGKELVVYCHHGVRSMMAATWLDAQGIGPVLNLDGGIDAWSIGVDRTVARY